MCSYLHIRNVNFSSNECLWFTNKLIAKEIPFTVPPIIRPWQTNTGNEFSLYFINVYFILFTNLLNLVNIIINNYSLDGPRIDHCWQHCHAYLYKSVLHLNQFKCVLKLSGKQAVIGKLRTFSCKMNVEVYYCNKYVSLNSIMSVNYVLL